ncbi:hypothetical protein dsx2_1679 [Desulfovibrio sp. X2]|uniref:hypothetical protein n=1 Tax=Desulfovibrio sp. X2 TaxID=941449 RepID=UPI0003589500|nr:hypothetical protein [Desulfovibrio sp. X2]EPR44318.1 hypothetical protein dsx2_1679 [Desulfovibrio sp. X2]
MTPGVRFSDRLPSLLRRTAFPLLLGLVLALALFFRCHDVSTFPPGVWYDEAVNALDGMDAAFHHGYRVFFPDNYGREGLFIDAIGLSFKTFGLGMWQMKLPSIVLGALGVLLAALLCRRLYGGEDADGYAADRDFGRDAVALLAAFFVAVSFWDVNFSRIAFRAIGMPVFLAACLCCIWDGGDAKGGKRRAPGPWLLALGGLFCGLGLHTYTAFKAFALVLPVPVLVDLRRLRREAAERGKNGAAAWLRPLLTRWGAFALGTAAGALPLVVFAMLHPDEYFERMGQLSVFSLPHPWLALAENLAKSVGMFVVQGDANWRHNIGGAPLLAWPVRPFFLLGLALCAYGAFAKKVDERRRERSVLLLAWWGVMLLPAALSNEGVPHALRSLGSLLPTYIMAAEGAVFAFARLSAASARGREAAAAAALLLLLGLPVLQFHRYFTVWGQDPRTHAAFQAELEPIAQAIEAQPNGELKVLLTAGVPQAKPVEVLTLTTPNLEVAATPADIRLPRHGRFAIFALGDGIKALSGMRTSLHGSLLRGGSFACLLGSR